MKRSLLSLLLLAASTLMVSAHVPMANPEITSAQPIAEVNTVQNKASITFKNQSNYTLTLKIMYAFKEGLYHTMVLKPNSNTVVYFSSSNTFRIKIKAKPSYGRASYHDGGYFSVTCNSYEHSVGEMTFQLSSYGNGLGPGISAEEFEKN